MLTLIQNPVKKRFICQFALQSGVTAIYYVAGVKMGCNPKALKTLATCHWVSSSFLYASVNYRFHFLRKATTCDQVIETWINSPGDFGINVALCGMLFGLPLIGFIAGATWKTQLLSFLVLNASTYIIDKVWFEEIYSGILSITDVLRYAFKLDKDAQDGHSILPKLSDDSSYFQCWSQIWNCLKEARGFDKKLSDYEHRCRVNIARVFIYERMIVKKSRVLKIKKEMEKTNTA